MPRYDELRGVLGSPYRNMSSAQIETMMESLNVNAEDMENFLSTLGNIGRSVVSALPQVLPVALPMVGTAIGGPIGGMIGGMAGQALGSALGQGGQPGAPQPRAQPYTQMPAPRQGMSAQMPAGSPAAGQLLQTLFRPQTLQALISMLMGQMGRPNVPVGNTQVPVGAFTNLLGALANQAAAEYSATPSINASAGHGYPRYLENFAGETYGDPAIPEHRAAALLNLLQEADLEQDESHASRRPAQRASYEFALEADEGIYDEMESDEMLEFYGEYEFS